MKRFTIKAKDHQSAMLGMRAIQSLAEDGSAAAVMLFGTAEETTTRAIVRQTPGGYVVHVEEITPRAAITPTPAEPTDASAFPAEREGSREAKSPLHAEAETAGGER